VLNKKKRPKEELRGAFRNPNGLKVLENSIIKGRPVKENEQLQEKQCKFGGYGMMTAIRRGRDPGR